MNYLPAMEWNAKWDWENLVMLNSRAIGSPKKVPPTYWGLEEGGDMEVMSFNLSGGGSGGGGSGSDVGFGSSAKSSISASTDSSPEGFKTSNLTFETFESFAGDFNKKKEFIRAERTGNSPPLEDSVGSGEPLIGLKLGKRTYFENHCGGTNAKNTSFSVLPVSSTSTAKKIKSSSQTTPLPRCQVEGCNLDLSSAKEYHRKHRVCESHSKCPKVTVGGLERRFCQQCSRFHSLSEFDEKKRSCRRRLSDHNARRRKPQPEAISFNSTRLSSSFYDGRHQMSFELNNAPLVHTGPAANLTWDSSRSSKFTITKECHLEPEKAGGVDGLFSHDSNRLLPGKGPTVFSQDIKDSMFSSNLDAAPDLRRALSLLSTNSWGSQPEPASHHPMHASHYGGISHPAMHEAPQVLPLASSDYWQAKQHLTESRGHTLVSDSDGNNHFQDTTQQFKTPFATSFYANQS